jgi:HK97 family phage portal protein
MGFERLYQERQISYQTLWGAGEETVAGTLSGVVMDSDTAFEVNAVFSAVSLIADTISTLPVDAYKREGDARVLMQNKPDWVEKPDIDTTREGFYSAIITSMLLDGNAFIRIFSSPQGRVLNLVVLNPKVVKIGRNGLGRVQFTVDEKETLSTDQVLHIPDVVRPGNVRGVSRIDSLRENLALALALEKFAANFFGSGTTLGGVIEFPGNLTADQAKSLANGFDNRHKGWSRSGKTGVLSGGATFKATQVEPEKSQALEARHMAVEDVARAFKVPPHLLALPGTNSFASVEMTNLAWVTHGLRPIITKIERALSPVLARGIDGVGSYLKFNLDGLLRADIQSRMSAYSTGLQSGFLTINDVRKLEELAPMADPSADAVRVPLANVDLAESGVRAQRERVLMVQALVLAGFDPAGALAALELPEIAHTGLASSQLQPVSQVDPDDPDAAYKDEVV